MSDYHVAFQYKGTPIAFDLLAGTACEGKKVKLGGNEFVLALEEASSEKRQAIEQIFKKATEQKIKAPGELQKISELQKFSCVKKVAIRPLGKEGFVAALALKIHHLQLAILHLVFFPITLLYYAGAYLIRQLSKPAAKSLIHERLDRCEKEKDEKPLAEFGFKVGEWSAIRGEQATESLTLPFALKTRVSFTKSEALALEILYNKRANLNMLTDEEKQAVIRFLAVISGNMDFNRRISSLIPEFPEKEEFVKILEGLREFSFKMKKLEQLDALSKKLAAIEPKVANLSSDLPKEEKLSLSDFREADSLMSLQEEVFELHFVKKLALWKSMEASPYRDVQDKLTQVKKGIDAINQRFNRESGFQAGDIVFDDMFDKKSYDNRAFDITEIFDWMTLFQESIFRRQFCHAAIGLETKTKERQELRVSEVRNEYGISDISYSTLCISRVCRLDFERVVSKEGMNALSALWGDKSKLEVLKAVEERYKKNLQAFLRGEKFTRYKNDVSRMCLTTLKRNTFLFKRDLAELERELKPPKDQKKKTEEIFCSEFVGKVLCYTLYTLDLELKDALAAAKLKVPAGDVIYNPISAYENFEALHPQRLFALLEPYALEVSHPEFTRYLLK